jgi:hypothetical protein
MTAWRPRLRWLMRGTVLMVLALAAILTSARTAFAAGPWWHISSEMTPASLSAGGEGQLVIVASNLGYEPVDATTEPVHLAVRLPPGLSASAIAGTGCSLATLTCSFEKGVVNPYGQFIVTLHVKAESSGGSLPVEASVQGGGAPRTSRTVSVPVGGEPGFGVEEYELAPFNVDGSPATQAGAHPFQLTTILVLNQIFPPTGQRQPVALPKDFSFHLPAGVVGNVNALEQCSMANFFAFVFETNLCASDSVVGVATVTADEPQTFRVFTRTVPLFNLAPAQGEPARFGFEVLGLVPIVIDTSVRSGQDYGVDVSVKDATQTAGLLASKVTLWGTPGDPRHNSARGWECVAGGAFAAQVGTPCPVTNGLPEKPFLTMPTSCAPDPQTEPVRFSMQANSWANPGNQADAESRWMNSEGALQGFEGCGQLRFEPAIAVSAEEHTASTPTGVDVSVEVPQTGMLEADGLAEADVRDTTVTLPEGVMLNPSAANGLEGCSEAQIGFTGFDHATQTNEFNTGEPACPAGSKVGTVRIKTPLLSHELEGAAYLASPAPNGEEGRNPFNSLVALYIVAEDPVSGVLVKLAGEGHLDEGTLRISTSFKNTPQVPFEELSLHLFGGQRASVTTPPLCGSYTTSAIFTPWSGTDPVSPPVEPFSITSGVGGSACPAGALPFSPGFLAGSGTQQAGAFTSFNLELTRADGDQALGGLSMHLPSGIAALLSAVELCSDEQAAASACPPGSEVGQATAIAGLGSEPYVQEGGRVFITEQYGDAPFGLEIVTPAKAGPFDLGYVTVRSKLYVDPTNASVTIVSDPLPTQIRGIPLQLKRVLVTVDRPGFEFNPTNCEPMGIEGTITGAEGASAGVSSPFQAGGCEALPFSPQLTANAVGQGSKADGTTFAVTVRSGGTNTSGVAQAGIAKVQLQLPKQLSSRLPTLQKACTDAVFNTNPASCDEGSVIGYATIHTPVLKNPLTGPAYLVSHGGAAFPDVEFVLQGEGIKLVLDGQTDIKGEVTYSRFESTPDAPFTVFETVLPAGPHGVLTPNVPEAKRFSLCGETLTMPTTMIAQNGMRIEQDTKVAVTGCEAEVRSVKVSKITLRQEFERSLRSCGHKYRLAKHKRQRCEHRARTRYTRKALAACKHKDKHADKKRKACVRHARMKYGPSKTRSKAKSKAGSKR